MRPFRLLKKLNTTFNPITVDALSKLRIFKLIDLKNVISLGWALVAIDRETEFDYETRIAQGLCCGYRPGAIA
jgi:hypothetical protein